MSKIDLLDQKWIDLVFEGKNEAYGAYAIRQNTNKRNLYAMLAQPSQQHRLNTRPR